jgi:hypothetical protein
MARHVRTAALVMGFAVLAGCDNPFPPGAMVRGTFGGNNAGLMADDTSAHVHIGCTYGDVHQPIVLDLNSRFDVPGEQDITAFPVDRGILHPARFTGSIDGRTMTLTVTLTDTAVTLGPVSLTFEKEPNMGPCPICFGKGARGRRVRLTRL